MFNVKKVSAFCSRLFLFNNLLASRCLLFLQALLNLMNKKIYIETYGCQMNVADSETVAGIMIAKIILESTKLMMPTSS